MGRYLGSVADVLSNQDLTMKLRIMSYNVCEGFIVMEFLNSVLYTYDQ